MPIPSGYCYILISEKDGQFYVGSTTDLKRRLHQHTTGQVAATKNRLPVKLYAYQQFPTIQKAAEFEKKYKRSHDAITRMLKKGNLIKMTD